MGDRMRRCLFCDKVLIRHEGEATSHWKVRKYCNRECSNAAVRRPAGVKHCFVCGKLMSKRPHESLSHYKVRNTCGEGCRVARKNAPKWLPTPADIAAATAAIRAQRYAERQGTNGHYYADELEPHCRYTPTRRKGY